MSDELRDFFGWTLVLVLVCCAIFMLFWLMTPHHQQDRYESFLRGCSEQKGHIYKPDVLSLCLTSDGRIVEVYP